jgi:hypothetical protein
MAHREVAAREKAGRVADDADEKYRVVEAATVAMAWGLLGKEQEEQGQVQMTHRRSVARDCDRRESNTDMVTATEEEWGRQH